MGQYKTVINMPNGFSNKSVKQDECGFGGETLLLASLGNAIVIIIISFERYGNNNSQEFKGMIFYFLGYKILLKLAIKGSS